MRRVPGLITALASICMLAMQMGGLHRHVDAHGQEAGLHVAHVHHAGPENHTYQADIGKHDHSVEIDVWLLEELSTSWSKLVPLLFACAIVLAVAVWTQCRLQAPPIRTGKVRHRLRWRPPLRAPPISL